MQNEMLQERMNDSSDRQLDSNIPAHSGMANRNPYEINPERPLHDSPDYYPVNGKHGPDDEDEDEADEDDLILGDADEAEGDEEEFEVLLDEDINEDDIHEDDLVIDSDDDIDDEEDDL